MGRCGGGSFVGDGQYPGDGGRELQTLWDALLWREIKGCPGRYTTRSSSARELEPREFLTRFVGKFALPDGSTLVIEKEGKDPMVCVRFAGGGGLLTYCKADKGAFVHTLNTESGLCRKLDALKVDAGLLSQGDPIVQAYLRAVVALLGYIAADADKNASARHLVRLMRDAAHRMTCVGSTMDSSLQS